MPELWRLPVQLTDSPTDFSRTLRLAIAVFRHVSGADSNNRNRKNTPVQTIRYIVIVILTIVVGTVQADVQQTEGAAELMDDYHETGFLSDYSRLQPDETDDHALIYRDPTVDTAKYNKLLIDRIKIFFKDAAAYKGIDPTELKALTDYFHDAIVKAVSAEPNGYPVVTETGPDVVHLRLAVTNVVPNKPEASVVSLAVPFASVGALGSWPIVAQGPVASLSGSRRVRSVELRRRRALTTRPPAPSPRPRASGRSTPGRTHRGRAPRGRRGR